MAHHPTQFLPLFLLNDDSVGQADRNGHCFITNRDRGIAVINNRVNLLARDNSGVP